MASRDTSARNSGPVTLVDIAERVGVSRTSVSNAFNRPDQLSDELRARILSTAKAMGYGGPHPAARMLRTGRTGAIGLLFGETLPYAFSDPVATAFLQGVAEVVEQAALGLLMLPCLDADVAAEALRRAAIDGLLVYSIPEDTALVRGVRERQLPFVTIDQVPVTDVPSVVIEDEAGARACAEHLIAQGHRRIGVLAMEVQMDGQQGPVSAERRARIDYPPTRWRLAGYEAALHEAGLEVAALEEGFNREADGYESARRILRQHPRPTALLCMSDRLAFGAISAAHDLGLAVPEDVSIVGFDDTPQAALVDPPLTTVYQPAVDKGRAAGYLLLRQLDEGTPSAAPHQEAPDAEAAWKDLLAEPATISNGEGVTRVTLHTRLVVRASTTPAP